MGDYGARLKLLRTMAGLTQGELAKGISKSKQYVSLIEREEISITQEQMIKIKDFIIKKDNERKKNTELKQEEYSPPDLGSRIKYARIEKGLSRETLSSKIGVSYTALGFYETNTRKPKIETFKKIAMVLEKPMEYFTGEKAQKEPIETNIIPMKNTHYVPLFGEVRAGSPEHGDTPPIEGYMPLPHEITVGKAVSGAFKVSSDSMEPKILKGMYVLISTERMVVNGDIALVHIIGDGTCIKTIKFVDDRVHLIPENKKYPVQDLKGSEVHILGKVVGWVNYEV